MSVPPPYDAAGPGAENPEALIPTPARGVPVDGPPPNPGPTAAPRRRRAALVAQVAALVLGLAGTAWFSTEYLREVWPGAGMHVPVPVSEAGTATFAGITVSLVEATDLGATPSLPESDWQPPAGFHAWRVVLETSSTNEDVASCEVALIDDRGRQFEANDFVDSFVEGYEWLYDCGVIEPEDEIGPQQAVLVLVPADAEIRTVRIWNTFLLPEFVELEV